MALCWSGRACRRRFDASVDRHDARGRAADDRHGPVASQIAIKKLGTNGGGFFNANSAHPFENPTALTNFLQMVAIFVIPAALDLHFGHMVGDQRQGWAIFAAMGILFLVGVAVAYSAERRATRLRIARRRSAASVSRRQHGGQGGALRRRHSALFAAITTAASCGAVNAMHDSFMPLGGMMPCSTSSSAK